MKQAKINPWRRLGGIAAKVLIVLAVFWCVRGTLLDAWEGLGAYRWQLHVAWLALSGIAYGVATFFCAVFWHYVLRCLGQEVGFFEAIYAFFLGHLGKYVPGKAMVVVLRAGLIRQPGNDFSLAVLSVFYETLTMMSVGATMAAGIVAACFPRQPLLFWPAVGLALVAGLPTLPPVFRRIAHVVGIGRRNRSVMDLLDRLDYKSVAVGWALNAAGWALLGVSLWAVLQALGGGANAPFAQIGRDIAAVALATVAGFVSFLPGGMLVREAVLAEVLAPSVGSGLALASAVLLRLVWLISELAISAIFVIMRSRFFAGDKSGPR